MRGAAAIIGFVLLSLNITFAQQLVFINEVLTSPEAAPGTTGTNANSLYNVYFDDTPSMNREFVELYNPNLCDSVDISCYTLGSNMYDGSTPNWGAFTFPQGTVIPPGGFLLIGGNDVQGATPDFIITDYRQNGFGQNYLTGYPNRWFLRDVHGWIALFNPQGNAVDAVYWSASPSDAITWATQFQFDFTASTTCGGSTTFPAAKDINNIEWVGHPQTQSLLSFQRVYDGSPSWHSTPVTPTPAACNGVCNGPPDLNLVGVDEKCDKKNGKVIAQLTPHSPPPFYYSWTPAQSGNVSSIHNLEAGTFMVEVRDAYDCLFVYDTVTLENIPGPEIKIDSVWDDVCSEYVGSAYVHIDLGTPPFSIQWDNQVPAPSQYGQGLNGGWHTVIVSDKWTCNDTTTFFVGDHPPPSTQMLVEDDTCLKGVGSAWVIMNGGEEAFWYAWNNGSTTYRANNLHEGWAVVELSDSICEVKDSIYVGNYHDIWAELKAEPGILYLNKTELNCIDLTPNSISWIWGFGDGFYSTKQHPTHYYQDTGQYEISLVVQSALGCKDTNYTQVRVIEPTYLYIPNAFTPNGDGKNDFFSAKGIFIYDFEMEIFNRWGDLIFRTKDMEKGWDGFANNGDTAPQGVYIYRIKYFCDTGDLNFQWKQETGQVTLIR